MANDSFCNLSDKGCAFTSHKEDVITKELLHFRIALQIMAGYPEVLNEFKKAVKSDGNQTTPGRTEEPCLERINR
jgi:hypothetical protein